MGGSWLELFGVYQVMGRVGELTWSRQSFSVLVEMSWPLRLGYLSQRGIIDKEELAINGV